MIISHRHKFIFIKTEKTAGTSIEIALSKFCGPSDVITPMASYDQRLRKSLGYRGPQNYHIPLSRYSKRDYRYLLLHRQPPCFTKHMGAKDIIRYVSEDIWSSYFKFCFERNPWDKIISWYYWKHKKEPRPPISDFIHSKEANTMKGFELYTINAEVVVDKVYLYEDLQGSLRDIQQRLHLDEPIILPNAKSNFRVDRTPYKNILSNADRDKIACVYAREIALLGYSF